MVRSRHSQSQPEPYSVSLTSLYESSTSAGEIVVVETTSDFAVESVIPTKIIIVAIFKRVESTNTRYAAQSRSRSKIDQVEHVTAICDSQGGNR